MMKKTTMMVLAIVAIGTFAGCSSSGSSEKTTIDQAEATDLGAGRWGVIVGGWAGWLGVSPDQRLLVVLAPGAGRIVRATAFRLPRPDIPRSTERYAAGFGLRLEIETPDGAGPAAGALRVFARDAQGTWSLPQPVIKLAKSPRVVWPLPPGATPPQLQLLSEKLQLKPLQHWSTHTYSMSPATATKKIKG